MKKSVIFFINVLFILSGLGLKAQNRTILPAPQNIQWGKEKFQISGAKVFVSADLYSREQKSIDQFIGYVKQNTGLNLTIIYSEDPNSRLIVLKSNPNGSVLAMNSIFIRIMLIISLILDKRC